MPTYDYLCDACGHELELIQSMSEAPKRKCPACGKQKLRRLIGAGGAILFKGSGFYETDYRSDSYQKGAKAEKERAEASKKAESETASSSDSKGKSEGKSESKGDK